MLIINRLPLKSNNDDEHYEALVSRQTTTTTVLLLYQFSGKMVDHGPMEHWLEELVITKAIDYTQLYLQRHVK